MYLLAKGREVEQVFPRFHKFVDVGKGLVDGLCGD